MSNKDCIFCSIAAGDSPAEVLLENSDIIVIKSIDPVADTHLLVIPKDHVEAFLDIKPESKTINAMLRAAQEMIKKEQIESGYKLVFNGGEYQYVKHLHWHLLGGKMHSSSEAISKT